MRWLQGTLPFSALAAASCAGAALAGDAPSGALRLLTDPAAISGPNTSAQRRDAAAPGVSKPFLVAQSAANAAPVETLSPPPAPPASAPAPNQTAAIEVGDKDPGKPAGDGTGSFDVAPKATPETPELIAEGKKTYNGTCAHCHGPDAVLAAKKLDLRRLSLRYADGAHNMYWKTVHEGRQTKGMPAWKEVFTDQQLAGIYSFLASVQSKE